MGNADTECLFADRSAMRAWLAAHHGDSRGIWVVLGRHPHLATVSAAEALEEALCFGWIDGQIRRVDETRYIKRFTPRRPQSTWSARNLELADRLAAAGLMTPAGAQALASARAAGRVEAAPRPAVTAAEVAALVTALAGHPQALENLSQMAPSVQKTYAAHYAAARREETKARRLEHIAARLEANLKPM